MSEKFIDLREQIRQEMERKKHCANSTYECTLSRVDGSEYCMKHTLREGRGNFHQCTFAFGNGRRCLNAAHDYDTKKDSTTTTLCFEHSRQAALRKTHSTVGKYHKLDTNEALLSGLTLHLNVKEFQEKAENSEQEEEIDVVSADTTPFSLLNQIQDFGSVQETQKKRRRIVDYASDSSIDDEPLTCNKTSQEYNLKESDDESITSDDDVLEHAGIYTKEEVVKISLKKYTKLKLLYQNQFSYLQHLLKERRRRYLNELRKERETLCSIHEQPKDNPKEIQAYEELKALNSYHRRHGKETLLFRKYKEKRNRLNDNYSQKGPGFLKCNHSDGGIKCRERVIPCSKYCRKHILEDKKQVLFRPCNVEKSGVICQEPVPCIFEDAVCSLHMTLPSNKQLIPKKFDSESDEEIIDFKHETADTEEEKLLKVKVEFIKSESIDIKNENDLPKETEIISNPLTETIKEEIKLED